MIVKAAQWGNSIGVRIPRVIAFKKGITVNSTVEIKETKNGIIIKPIEKRVLIKRAYKKGYPAEPS